VRIPLVPSRDVNETNRLEVKAMTRSLEAKTAAFKAKTKKLLTVLK